MAGKLLAGLGNPGAKYVTTRHNVGFMVIDHLARRQGVTLSRKSFNGLLGELSCWGNRLFLLKPQTFMNLSGHSVAAALRFHKLPLSDLIVIHDELDIPFGRIKLKQGGGHGGHNGLRSLMQELGSGDFTRVRVGIGRPDRGDASDYVLSPFSKDDQSALAPLLDGVVDCLQLLVTEGLPKAMSIYHHRDFLAAPQ
jgi:PTH1 family peptidyl-tRNA hydrolase